MSAQNEPLEEFAKEELDIDIADKPNVQMPGKGVQVRDTAMGIYEAVAPKHEIFWWSNTVVQLESIDDSASRQVSIVTPSVAITEFEKHVRFVRPKGKELEGTILNDQMAKAILNCDIAASTLPRLRAVLDTPIPMLRDSKFEVLTSGYNAASGFYVTGEPLREPDTLKEAVNCLKGLVLDFDFQTGSDESRAIAMLLTPALKLGGFINGHVPIDVIEAEESQSGKGFLVDLRSMLYGQEPSILAKQKDGAGSLDERIGSMLLRGKPFIVIDNFRGRLDSQNLESFLTARGDFAVRVPYSGEKFVKPGVFFIAVTSNGAEMTPDLANRASFITIKKKKGRGFIEVEGMRIDQVLKLRRSNFMGAVAKIIRHWHGLGMPKSKEKRHSFEEWASVLNWIVVNIFECPPLLDGNREAQKRAENPALSFARVLAVQVANSKQLNVKLKASELANLCESGSIEVPGLQQQTYQSLNKVMSQRIGTIMLQAFGKDEVVRIDNYTIERSTQSDCSKAGNLFPSPVYVFRDTTDQTEESTEEGTVVNRS